MRWLYMIPYALVIVALCSYLPVFQVHLFPEEDQGILMTLVQLPAGSTQNQTQAVMEKVNAYYKTQEKRPVECCIYGFIGFSFAGPRGKIWIAFGRA